MGEEERGATEEPSIRERIDNLLRASPWLRFTAEDYSYEEAVHVEDALLTLEQRILEAICRVNGHRFPDRGYKNRGDCLVCGLAFKKVMSDLAAETEALLNEL